MQLSLRLSAIADLVTEGNRLVDVGCDHGYLPVYLIQQKKIPSAIAMDVRKGPLSRAQEHIRQYGLEEYIQTRLSDGLKGLKAGEGDTLVIAGMGGPLMERILTDGRSVRNSFSELIPDLIAQGYKLVTVSEMAAAKNVTLQPAKYAEFWQSALDAGYVPGYNGNGSSEDSSTDGTSDGSSDDSSNGDESDFSDGSGDGSDGSESDGYTDGSENSEGDFSSDSGE